MGTHRTARTGRRRTLVGVMTVAAGAGLLLTGTAAAASSSAEAGSACPNAASLGAAAGFTEFALGDAARGKPSASDSEGAVAYGGNATFDQFYVGQSSGSITVPHSLVVGGDVHGTIDLLSGTTGRYTGTSTATSASNAGAPVANLERAATSPVDFAAATSTLRATSARLADQPSTTTGTTAIDGNKLLLTGTNATLDVFDLEPGQLAGAVGIFIKVPAGATTLINVPDQHLPLVAYQYTSYWNGSAWETGAQYNSATVEGLRRNTLFNVHAALDLGFTNATLSGTVLAPRAAFTFNRGLLDGAVIANTITGDFQSNITPGLAGCQDPAATAATTTPTTTRSSGTGSTTTTVAGASTSTTAGVEVAEVLDESVTATPAGELPRTGATPWYAVAGTVLVGLGSVLVGLGRRRRSLR